MTLTGVVGTPNQAATKAYVDAAAAYLAGAGINLVGKTFSISAPVGVSLGGTGSTATPANGQLLVGNSGAYTPTSLVAGQGISIANTPGTITVAVSGVVTQAVGTTNQVIVSPVGGTGVVTLSLPQSIDTSAIVQFATVNVTNAPTTGTNATNKSYVDTVATYLAGNGLTLSSKTFALASPVTIANGGTGTTSVPLSSQLLVGNGSGYDLRTLVAGSGIAIAYATGTMTISASSSGVTQVKGTTNQVTVTPAGGTGIVTLSLPQSIDTTANVTFANITIPNAPSIGTNATNKTYVDAAATYLAGNGLSLTGTGATKTLALVTPVSISNGGTGISTTPAFNQIPVGTGTNYALKTITAGTGINIANSGTTLTFSLSGGGVVTQAVGTTNQVIVSPASGTGVVTLSLPQSIHTAANVQFATVGISNAPTAGTNATNKTYVDSVSTYLAGTGLTLNTKTFALATPVSVVNGGTGRSAVPLAGQLLIGNGTGYTLGTIAAGAGIYVTNSAGSISITNNGITGITGTANQVTVTKSGTLATISLPNLVSVETVRISNGVSNVADVTNKGYVDGAYRVSAPLTLATDISQQFKTIGLGVLSTSFGGTGLTAPPTNGQLPIGTGSGYALATLTAGTGISITNASGSITIAGSTIAGTTNQVVVSQSGNNYTLSLPQSIGTTSNVTFGSVTVSALPTANTQLANKQYVDQQVGTQSYLAGAGLTLTSKTFSLSAPVAVASGGTGTTQTPVLNSILLGRADGTYVL